MVAVRPAHAQIVNSISIATIRSKRSMFELEIRSNNRNRNHHQISSKYSAFFWLLLRTNSITCEIASWVNRFEFRLMRLVSVLCGYTWNAHSQYIWRNWIYDSVKNEPIEINLTALWKKKEKEDTSHCKKNQ